VGVDVSLHLVHSYDLSTHFTGALFDTSLRVDLNWCDLLGLPGAPGFTLGLGLLVFLAVQFFMPLQITQRGESLETVANEVPRSEVLVEMFEVIMVEEVMFNSEGPGAESAVEQLLLVDRVFLVYVLHVRLKVAIRKVRFCANWAANDFVHMYILSVLIEQEWSVKFLITKLTLRFHSWISL